MDSVSRHVKTYESWRSNDPGFKQAVEDIRDMRNRQDAGERKQPPQFDEFCKTYLHQPLFRHQLQWWDLLEAREPRDMHRAITYHKGEPEKILINTPVFHAKSATVTVNYAVYRICADPNVRILLVSQTQDMAKKFLYAIKNRLVHPAYKELQIAFAPEGGYKASADAWTANMIYIGGDGRDSGEKDPTVQALGIGGHIYGARADLIIIDDGVTLKNAHEFEKQIEWLEAEVETRLTPAGQLVVVGTRVAPMDLYAELVNNERYIDGESPWTQLTQPAVLEFDDDPAKWETLWPAAQEPCQCRDFCNKGDIDPDENGNYPKWDGNHMGKIRGKKSPRTWSLVYMQQQIIEDAVFNAACVRAAIDGTRMPGPLHVGARGSRPQGMEGLYVIAGLDPAMTENTAAIVMGVDRGTSRRWVLDVFDRRNVTPTQMRDLIKDWTIRYGVHEWRIEKNAFQIFLTQDAEINTFLAGRGCLLREHYTGKNKWDGDFGVASMSLLFGTHRRETSDKGGLVDRVEGGLIGLPSTKESEACKRFVEQLITWAPETKNKVDIVMALWFCEIRAREIANATTGSNFLPNKFIGRARRGDRMVVNLDLAFQDQRDHIDRPDWHVLPQEVA